MLRLPLLRAVLAAGALGWLPCGPGSPCLARAETPVSLSHLPESNPYRAALVSLVTAPAEDRAALDAWLNPPTNTPPPNLTAAQQALVRSLTAAVVTSAQHPPLTREDWPVQLDAEDPENLLAATIPDVGIARKFARIATKAADSLPPSEALPIYAAAAQLGRQQRAGATLIHQLTGVAIEGIARDGPARRLHEFDAAQLRRLATEWHSLTPAPEAEAAIAGERDLFFIPLARTIILKAVKELLAAQIADAAAEGADSTSTFTRDLRLSGLINLGDNEPLISLENIATGQHFSIAVNRAAEGIELVSIDFENRQAVIRRGSREAVIHLESKKIVERRPPGPRTLAVLKDLSFADDAARDRWLTQIASHPGGPEGYIADLIAAYENELLAQLADAAQAKAAPPRPGPDDPFLALLTPSFGQVARTFYSSSTSTTLFQAAIHHRLAELGEPEGEAPAPADPWADADAPAQGFTFEPTPDGGFLLRSRFEPRPDAPLTYKFGAPDAGFVRKK